MNFDKSKVRQIIKGISKAVDLGYIRKVYEINEMFTNGFGSVETAAVDMDIGKVAQVCGLSEEEFKDAIGYVGPVPVETNTIQWLMDKEIGNTYTSKDDIKSFFENSMFVEDQFDVDEKIDDLKESISKAQKTLARLQNMKESDKSGSKKDMLRKITSAWGQEIFGYAPAVTFLDDDNFDIKFRSHEDAEQFADLWSEALDFSYDDYIENAENMSYSPIDEDTYDNLQKIYDRIVGETPSVEDFGVGSAEYELAENIDDNVIHSYFSNF